MHYVLNSSHQVLHWLISSKTIGIKKFGTSSDEAREEWTMEMKLWEMAMNIEAKKRVLTAFLTLESKAGDKTELKMWIKKMEKVYIKLDTLFIRKKMNQCVFIDLFRNTHHQKKKTMDTSVHAYIIELDHLWAKLSWTTFEQNWIAPPLSKIELDHLWAKLRNHIKLPKSVLAWKLIT